MSVTIEIVDSCPGCFDIMHYRVTFSDGNTLIICHNMNFALIREDLEINYIVSSIFGTAFELNECGAYSSRIKFDNSHSVSYFEGQYEYVIDFYNRKKFNDKYELLDFLKTKYAHLLLPIRSTFTHSTK